MSVPDEEPNDYPRLQRHQGAIGGNTHVPGERKNLLVLARVLALSL